MTQAEGQVGVAVVGEDAVHRALAMALFDGALRALAVEREADWLLEADHHRQWLVFDGGERRRRAHLDSHGDWQPIGPGGRPVRTHGFINGRPAGAGAAKLHKLYLHHRFQDEPPDVVLVLMDTDGDEEIAESAAQVLAEVRQADEGPALVIGTPHRDAEGWLLATPLPDDPASQARLAAAKGALSFDPTRAPERLSAAPNDAVTDAKRVLRYLLLGDGDRLAAGSPASRPPSPEQADALAQRLAADLGRAALYTTCRLADFVAAVRAVVAGAFADHLPPAAPR